MFLHAKNISIVYAAKFLSEKKRGGKRSVCVCAAKLAFEFKSLRGKRFYIMHIHKRKFIALCTMVAMLIKQNVDKMKHSIR